MEKVNMAEQDQPTYDGQRATDVTAILKDHVAGTEITVWFETADGPIGLHLWDDRAKDLRDRLTDCLKNID
jgi:hypothetical protein